MFKSSNSIELDNFVPPTFYYLSDVTTESVVYYIYRVENGRAKFFMSERTIAPSSGTLAPSSGQD